MQVPRCSRTPPTAPPKWRPHIHQQTNGRQVVGPGTGLEQGNAAATLGDLHRSCPQALTVEVAPPIIEVVVRCASRAWPVAFMLGAEPSAWRARVENRRLAALFRDMVGCHVRGLLRVSWQ